MTATRTHDRATLQGASRRTVSSRPMPASRGSSSLHA